MTVMELELVEAPLVFPNRCVVCRSAQGPLVDGQIELPGHGRMYWCEGCVSRAAVALGIAKGPRMEKLLKASKELAELKRQLAASEQRAEQLQARLRDETSRNGELQTLLAEGRAQLERQKLLISQVTSAFSELAAEV